MTIHYHGTPITPAAQLARMAGEHFCVSFYRPDNADVCEVIGQSVLWDNGAFSAYTKGVELDERHRRRLANFPPNWHGKLSHRGFLVCRRRDRYGGTRSNVENF